MVGWEIGDPQGGALYAPVNSEVIWPERIPIHILNGQLTPFSEFLGIDDRGRIFGWDMGRTFVLTPAPQVPEPASIVLLVTAMVGVATVAYRRRKRE